MNSFFPQAGGVKAVRALAVAALTLAAFATATGSANAQQTRIRVMGANISSGNLQSYDPGNGTRIFQGVKPDIVAIQEFNFGDNSATTINNWVKSTFGSSYTYARQNGVQIPNGVISRYPILASGSWTDTQVSNRAFTWARIDVPGAKDLWVVSVHLLTASSSVRNTEATNLKALINANVPASDYLVIAGDFNTDSRSEACLGTFSSIVNTGGPYPADRNGNGNTNASRAKPYDWVLANTALNQYRTAVQIGASTFANGLVADTRVYSPISEISPALASDSGSVNMQHMGVVTDYVIPGGTTPTPTPTPSPTPSPTPGPTPTPTPNPTPTPTPTPTATPTPTPGATTIVNVSNVAVTAGGWKNYTITVPAGKTRMVATMTAASSGDADLYIRKSSLPTTSAYDFAPYLDGSNEAVTVNTTTAPALTAGTWYVSVNGYTAATFNLTVTLQ